MSTNRKTKKETYKRKQEPTLNRKTYKTHIPREIQTAGKKRTHVNKKDTRILYKSVSPTNKRKGTPINQTMYRSTELPMYQQIGNGKTTPDEKSHIVKIFMEMLNTVKIYHWKTRSYAQHKATDELYSKLNENIDTFVETLSGKDGSRIKLMENEIELLETTSTTQFKQRIYEYRSFLISMNKYFSSKTDTDLLNIRDEILGNINQFLYLLTFDK